MSGFDARLYEKTSRIRVWAEKRTVSLCWATACVILVWVGTVLACR